MSDLTQEEGDKGKILSGVMILFWVTSIITGLGLLFVSYGISLLEVYIWCQIYYY